MKHTKGEWSIYTESSGEMWIESKSEKCWICDISTPSNESAKPNAKLIAAAPDLLKRSSDLLDSILSIRQYNKDVCTERDIKRIEKMQEAIKKAT